MKTISIVLTVLLLIPVIHCAVSVVQLYHSLNSGLMVKQNVVSIAKPLIFYGVSYFIFLIFSVLLNIKTKYKANVVISACLVLIYLVTINLI